MIVAPPSSAQVAIILASNDAVLIGQLTRDLRASKVGYFLVLLSDRENLTDAAAAQISAIGGISPVVFVIDHMFAGDECGLLVRATWSAPRADTIACVVVNPPADAARRQSLVADGARLFDGDSAETPEHLTLQ